MEETCMTTTEFLDWRSVESADNLVALFEERAARHPERLLIADSAIRLSWGEMDRAVRGFCAAHGDHDRGAVFRR